MARLGFIDIQQDMGNALTEIRALIEMKRYPTSSLLSERLKWSLSRTQKALRNLRESGAIERKAHWYGRNSYTWIYRPIQPVGTKIVISE